MKTGKTVSAVMLALLSLCLCILVAVRVRHNEPADEISSDPVSTQVPQESGPVAQQTAEPQTFAPEPASEPTPEPMPEPPDIDITEWQYRLVNTEHLLESDYEPELTMLEDGQYFGSRATDALQSFVNAAREAGLTAIVTSSYRSYATQQYLFNNKVNQTGSEEAAARIVAVPGSSEHQLGLSADIVDGYYEYMNESLADTALSQWMYEHCWQYGFILRYPEDKQDITNIMLEPWHFRYVGQEATQYIMENGLCLEEFVALYE